MEEEYVNAEQLGQRLGGIPGPTIARMSQPSKTADPIPHVKFARRVLYAVNSPELTEWIERHKVVKPKYQPRRKKRKC